MTVTRPPVVPVGVKTAVLEGPGADGSDVALVDAPAGVDGGHAVEGGRVGHRRRGLADRDGDGLERGRLHVEALHRLAAGAHRPA